MDERESPGALRRLRASEFGSAVGAGGATFDRTRVMREAVTLGVCLEDRAQLEALARFAFARSDFVARTTVRIGDDRSSEARFEVFHSEAGPVVRRIVAEDSPAVIAARSAAAAAVVPTGSAPFTFPASRTPAAPAAKPAIDPVPEPSDERAHGSDLTLLTEMAQIGRLAQSSATMPDDLGEVLTDATDRSPDLVAVFSSTGWVMKWANDALRHRLHLPAWVAPPLIELLDDWSQGRFVVRVLPALLSTGWWHGRLRVVGPDVPALEVSATLVVHRGPTGEISSVVLTTQPIVPETKDPRLGDAQFAALVEHVSDLIAVIEPAGSIRFASPAASAMLGREQHELTGTDLLGLIHPDDAVDRVADLVQVDEDGAGAPLSMRLRCRNGSWCSIEAVVTDLTANPTIGGFVLNARDVSARVQAQNMLGHLAYTDPDTGLPNRLRLLDRVTNLLENPTGTGLVTVLLIDLDRFRSINETLGSATGDAVISEIAARLVDGAGTSALVARLRSDEFAVALSDVGDGNVAERAAEALRVLVAKPFEHNGNTVRVTASIGIALGAAGDPADEILRRADQAAATAKQAGGNRVSLWGYESERHEHHRRAVESQLRRALEEDGLQVHYQPIVAIDTRQVVGAEALLRVHDDGGALLNPASFVEAAESGGIIAQLGEQMLRVTCEQMSRWGARLRARAPEHISVNVSPRQLIDPGLAAQVMAALEASAIEPNRLWLEVTESTLIGQHQLIGDRIAFLRDLGVRVGLDEFGAGYSTLGYLRRFPFDFVKIDRSLVAGLGIDDRDTAIVRATIELAHTLDLTVVAVGVENEEQLGRLAALGCDHAQGYLFSPPLAPDDLVVDLEVGLSRP